MKTVVFTFGRFNPPTVGHIKLAEKVKSVAKLNKADYKIYGSSSFDKKKNPLSPKIKERYMKKILRDKNAVVDSNVVALEVVIFVVDKLEVVVFRDVDLTIVAIFVVLGRDVVALEVVILVVYKVEVAL